MESYRELKMTTKTKSYGPNEEISIKRGGFDSIDLEDFREMCINLAITQGFDPKQVQEMFNSDRIEGEKVEKYMIYVEGKDIPKFVHTDYESALTEAKRLSDKEQRVAYLHKLMITVV